MVKIADYSVTLTIKNNYLLNAMKDVGIYTAAELSRASGVTQQTIGRYLNLSFTPYSKRGLRPSVDKLSKCLKKLPEDLFPPQHINSPLQRNVITTELRMADIKVIVDTGRSIQDKIEYKESMDSIMTVLDSLPEREQEILKRRFGFNGEDSTLDELAKYYKVSKERIRQIEKRAIRRLRGPRIKNLREAKEVILHQ